MRPSRRGLGYAFASTSSALQKAITSALILFHLGRRPAFPFWLVADAGESPELQCRCSNSGLAPRLDHTDPPCLARQVELRDVIRSKEEYFYSAGRASLLFGRVKIWGEVVEHEWGYRSEFGKIVSLDYGDPELLDRFRKIYRGVPG